MTISVSGAARWKLAVTDSASGIRLDYRCPSCRTDQQLQVQSLPWDEPVVGEGEDATGLVYYPKSAPSQEVVAWEARRARGEVKHRKVSEVTTQVWCHRCQQGSEVTLTLVEAEVERVRGELFPNN